MKTITIKIILNILQMTDMVSIVIHKIALIIILSIGICWAKHSCVQLVIIENIASPKIITGSFIKTFCI